MAEIKVNGRLWRASFNHSIETGAIPRPGIFPGYGTIRFESEGEVLFADNVDLANWESSDNLAAAFARAVP